MLGAEPVVDYSLANRTLLFDVDRANLVGRVAGVGRDWIAPSCRALLLREPSSAQCLGRVADELGLPANVAIVTGAHDQCANAVGCGVIQPGRAVYGMGTFICVTPVFERRREPGVMIERGLNTEHHAVPGQYVSFIYNQGGSLLKWFRDTFAAAERNAPPRRAATFMPTLISEIPAGPSRVMVLPHFTVTGPPQFIADSCGVIAGLQLETSRGDILKGILEGITFYLRECLESLPATGIEITDFRAVGGGSKSDAWIQICADIMGRPFVRPKITEAGVLGAAIIAGTGSGIFPSLEAGVEAMVQLDRTLRARPAETKTL